MQSRPAFVWLAASSSRLACLPSRHNTPLAVENASHTHTQTTSKWTTYFVTNLASLLVSVYIVPPDRPVWAQFGCSRQTAVVFPLRPLENNSAQRLAQKQLARPKTVQGQPQMILFAQRTHAHKRWAARKLTPHCSLCSSPLVAIIVLARLNR